MSLYYSFNSYVFQMAYILKWLFLFFFLSFAITMDLLATFAICLCFLCLAAALLQLKKKNTVTIGCNTMKMSAAEQSQYLQNLVFFIFHFSIIYFKGALN